MRGIRTVSPTELNEQSQAYLNSIVRIKATGATGTVRAVLPGPDGAPWSLHVHVHVEGDTTPYVLSTDEVERQVVVN